MLAEFDSILRFWFDRGIDGFRIDVADSMSKDDTLPDVHDPRVPGQPANKYPGHPHWDRDEVHDIHRRWRRIADEYADRPGGARTFVAEAWVTPPERLARYLRPDELHCAFNFDALKAPWDAKSQRRVIDDSTEAIWDVGASATWVLSNHDTIRHRTRYGRDQSEAAAPAGSVASDLELGLRRARAAALLELALPGGAYIYQGDELGLPEVEDLPETSSTTRSGSVPVVRSVAATAAAFRCRGRAPSHRSASAPVAASRGCRNRRAGRRSPPRRSGTIRPATSRCTAPRCGSAASTPPSATAGCSGSTPPTTCCVSTAIRGSVASSTSAPLHATLPAHADVLLTSVPLEDGQLPSDAAAWLSR